MRIFERWYFLACVETWVFFFFFFGGWRLYNFCMGEIFEFSIILLLQQDRFWIMQVARTKCDTPQHFALLIDWHIQFFSSSTTSLDSCEHLSFNSIQFNSKRKNTKVFVWWWWWCREDPKYRQALESL